MPDVDFDVAMMRRAIELAQRGEGWVEPNPMVGCVVTQGDRIVGEGWHRRYGEAHAEVNALQAAANDSHDATLYVTLEPCCHTGKTPPCSEAVIAAGVKRVVVAQPDPFGLVDGGGLQQLKAAGLQVDVGILGDEAQHQLAPYLKLVRDGRPWVIGKWAMTLDGKIASREFDSQWISNSSSREIVHRLRGRVDAIIVGRETALRDNPRLTARPAGARTPSRVVVDSHARLPLDSHLVTSAADAPVIVAASDAAPAGRVNTLESAGCEVLRCIGETREERLLYLLMELGTRRCTNVLVEGGGQLLGSLLDQHLLDEVHVFIAPKLVGGERAITPVAGSGADKIELGALLERPKIEIVSDDVYISGRTRHPYINNKRDSEKEIP